jgi:hypothetical protein
LWKKREIIAYSRSGYEKKTWQLPEDWREVRSVDLYRVTLDGRVPLSRSVPVKHATLALSLEEGECLSILPAGSRVSDRARPQPEAVRGGY